MSLSFQPHSINVIQKTCQRGGRESACLNATACFTTVSRSPGPQSNSFGITLYFFIDHKLTVFSLILLTITASVVNWLGSQMIRMGIFQHSPSVPAACGLLRSVGVSHVGRQEVVSAGAVWRQLPSTDPAGSPGSHRTNCLPQTALPCLRECRCIPQTRVWHWSIIYTPMQTEWLHFIGDTCVCLRRRTQQITSVQLASHCGSRSTTQRLGRCWMKAGQQLSRNLWVPQHWLFSFLYFFTFISHSFILHINHIPLI